MKEYNRTKKVWEEKKTEVVGGLKKPDLCKGRKPHDFELVLPPYVGMQIDRSSLSQETIEEYYKIDEEATLISNQYEDRICKLLGKKNRRFKTDEYRYYQCLICGKKK